MGVGEPRPSPDLPTLGAEAPHRRASARSSSPRGCPGARRCRALVPGLDRRLFFLCSSSSREDNSNSSRACGLCGQPRFSQRVARLEVWMDTGCHPGTSRRTRGELRGSSVRSTGRPSCPRVNPRVWAGLYPGAAQGDGGPNLPRRGTSPGLWTTFRPPFTSGGTCDGAVAAHRERPGPGPGGAGVPHTGDTKRPPSVPTSTPGCSGLLGASRWAAAGAAPGCRRWIRIAPGCGAGRTRVRRRHPGARRSGRRPHRRPARATAARRRPFTGGGRRVPCRDAVRMGWGHRRAGCGRPGTTDAGAAGHGAAGAAGAGCGRPGAAAGTRGAGFAGMLRSPNRSGDLSSGPECGSGSVGRRLAPSRY